MGHCSGMDIIENSQLHSPTELNGLDVRCIREHENLLYLLCHVVDGNSCEWLVKAYEMSDETYAHAVQSWKHMDTSNIQNKLAFYRDTVYIPSISQSKILSYTLTGSPVGKNIKVDLLIAQTALCISKSGYLILTQDSPSLIMCFDLNQKKQLWSISDIDLPQGVAIDQSGHALIYSGGCSIRVSLELLDVKTGKFILILCHKY